MVCDAVKDLAYIGDHDLCLKRTDKLLVLTYRFDLRQHLPWVVHQTHPPCDEFVVDELLELRRSWEERQMNRFFTLRFFREVNPQLLGGHGQNRGDESRQALSHDVHSSLSGTALLRPRAKGVQPILGDV